MPRSRSIFIQSDWVRRAWPRARTAPAARMAPPASSRFSVKVVLPASGCEMIAKVRRLAAWAATPWRDLAASAAGEVLMGRRAYHAGPPGGSEDHGIGVSPDPHSARLNREWAS